MRDEPTTMSANTVDLRSLFREHGLRCTRQREVIFDALATCRSHPTAEELLGMVREVESGLSLATVYNTLEVFSACGLCRKLPSAGGNGASRYDADIEPHIHVTLADGRIVDVPPSLSQRLLERIGVNELAELESELGLRITGVDLKLTGEQG